ncbi:DUF1190 domain-containing protein [Xanthomonas hyacinthi]|uniref:DUF1190 domain-containing protein n=1 Tax=Xanthomonas hyacinthi TaxID=56455 RepID=A0A2S7F2Q2_9XANT|nr:DUF1190 domain-containing protein [Xanthomonas hyacinthi]KLD74887.1 hypothetical protein Y886_30160 [Xanthomonas hyacinthi DSM 19077]PPU99617.1 DUF1190 domain-containing protein [Xanthomonas hyacinthi]QGY75749.1 DUF1190 domain-containing protein [Xanthomonas hyacinthi]
MKRSTNLKLSLMAATLSVPLIGCDSGPPTGEVLASPDQCSVQKEVSVEECKAAYQKAQLEHRKVAPRFQDQSQCNQQFGNCTPFNDERGQVSWIPPMAGFLIGYALGNAGGGYGGRTLMGAAPLYRDYRDGGYYKSNGDLAGRDTGTVKGNAGLPPPPSRAITVSRSGFGSSAAARSSFGGGRSSGFGG